MLIKVSKWLMSNKRKTMKKVIRTVSSLLPPQLLWTSSLPRKRHIIIFIFICAQLIKILEWMAVCLQRRLPSSLGKEFAQSFPFSMSNADRSAAGLPSLAKLLLDSIYQSMTDADSQPIIHLPYCCGKQWITTCFDLLSVIHPSIRSSTTDKGSLKSIFYNCSLELLLTSSNGLNVVPILPSDPPSSF